MARNTDQQKTADKFIGALKQDQFILYAQPIVPVRPVTGDAGYQEILIRYLEEEQKLLPPGGFIPVLEHLRLMPMLDRWVVNRVLKWIREKRGALKGRNPPRCSVNLSGDTVADPEFPRFVGELLRAGSIPPDRLSFEIAESDARAHIMALGTMIQELKPLGCSFAVTAYTGEVVSEKWLHMLGIDFAKIASAIIDSIRGNADSLAKTEFIHRACQAAGVRTIAAFVERRETLDTLKAIGIDYVQGFGVARPMPLD